MLRHYDVEIERTADGFYVATVPELPGCRAEAPEMEELVPRIQEAITHFLEEEAEPEDALEVLGDQRDGVAV